MRGEDGGNVMVIRECRIFWKTVRNIVWGERGEEWR